MDITNKIIVAQSLRDGLSEPKHVPTLVADRYAAAAAYTGFVMCTCISRSHVFGIAEHFFPDVTSLHPAPPFPTTVLQEGICVRSSAIQGLITLPREIVLPTFVIMVILIVTPVQHFI